VEEAMRKFNTKVAEIHTYFRLLHATDASDVRLMIGSTAPSRVEIIDSLTRKILKANGFLLLYNLVESTVKTSVESLYAAIKRERLVYGQVRTELRAVWVRQQFRELDVGEAPTSRYREKAREIIDVIVSNSVLELDAKHLPSRGTLDARLIKSICDHCGLTPRFRKAAQGGNDLVTVKARRNALAHGDESFAECGGTFSVGELSLIKKRIIIYCHDFVRGVHAYISNQEYRGTQATGMKTSSSP
jgi:MAE_28990/MAE_18760-like HEPN